MWTCYQYFGIALLLVIDCRVSGEGRKRGGGTEEKALPTREREYQRNEALSLYQQFAILYCQMIDVTERLWSNFAKNVPLWKVSKQRETSLLVNCEMRDIFKVSCDLVAKIPCLLRPFQRKVSQCASRQRIAPLGRDRFDRFTGIYRLITMENVYYCFNVVFYRVSMVW